MKFDFSGKNIVITGATSGIGLAAARLFCESGGAVFLCARHEERVEETVNALKEAGGTAYGFVCDVSNEGAVCAFGKAVGEASGGHVDVWVNNAGGMHRSALLDQTADAFHRLFAQNVDSVLWGCQVACALMGKGGVILNAASYSGRTPSVGQGAYSASKAAVASITATLASELAPRGIRVVGYAPGSIHTEMTDPAALKNTVALKRIPQRRMGTPAEVGALMLFLASPEAAYINGVSVPVDGGKLTTQAPEDAWV